MAAEATAVSGASQPKGGIGAWLSSVKEYFDDLKAEMRRVTWPAKKQVQATTAVVIAAIFLFAAYFAVVDLVLGRAVNQIFQTLARR
ncbi:MAG: preprotein translocase subunit SecE [Candidatus Solibacter usitatus]|nr:preprotein translocase subunit SecE [Candidatus Solibacter usitatus]